VAEYPSTLGGIRDMEKSGMAKVTKHDRRLQLARFFYTLNSIINHPKMKCQNRARLLPFNGEILNFLCDFYIHVYHQILGDISVKIQSLYMYNAFN